MSTPVMFVNAEPDDFPLTVVITESGTDKILLLEKVSHPLDLQAPRFHQPVDVLALHHGDGSFSCTKVTAEQFNRLLAIAMAYEPEAV